MQVSNMHFVQLFVYVLLFYDGDIKTTYVKGGFIALKLLTVCIRIKFCYPQ